MVRGAFIGICAFMLASAGRVGAQTVVNQIDPGEKVGARPYEMVWAKRTETSEPTVRFDSLDGWRMEVSGGAEAVLRLTRAQDLWGRPVAGLRYKGAGSGSSEPRVLLFAPSPVSLPDGSDSVDMWVYGNRWEWINPADTPAVRLIVHLRDGAGKAVDVPTETIRWEYWFLCHKKLPDGMQGPLKLESIEVVGGRQSDWREIFIDSIRFYREDLKPLAFEPRPMRNLTLSEGQSPGANTGPGRLPFPTREETILPMQFTPKFTNAVEQSGKGYVFRYAGKDCAIAYAFDPSMGLPGLNASVDGSGVGRLMDGAEVRKDGRAENPWHLKSVRLADGVVTATYDDGTELRLRMMQKSLVVDAINRGSKVVDLRFGKLSGIKGARTIWSPFMTFGGSHPAVLLSQAGKRWVYTSIVQDWYRSNGSEIYGQDMVLGETASINGGVRYIARTDGKLNPMFERVFVTVSPTYEEVLPVIANPVGLHAAEAVGQLWQESWGPNDYNQQMKRSRMIRAYGIKKLIQCNHEISWRDEGESFTLRTRSAPAKGGDDALANYVSHQRGLGWTSGLYTNYTDFAPVNEFWDPDSVQRLPNGEWRGGWPRCWALKPLRAMESESLIAPQVQKRYGGNSSYTDVHTAVPPWVYNDYDARVPGAGTLAQTFYAYGELLRNDSRVYGGPIFSEGTYQCLYAGLADGNYGHTYDGRQIANEPLLPAFDLYQIHTKECDIGISWTSSFCDAIPNWHDPSKIDNAIDRFLLHTLAYGHIGWLVEEELGIARTCRSYFMLRQVQARYGLKPPTRIAYWDGKSLVSTSEALVTGIPSTRRQLYIEYPGGLKLWLNDHPSEDWTVTVAGRRIVLPPGGWAASQGKGLFTYSAIENGSRVDYIRSGEYVYLDGRGQWFSTDEAASNGGLAIYPMGPNALEVIPNSGHGDVVVRRPFSVKGAAVSCEVYDAQGARLADSPIRDSGAETWIPPVKDGVRYILRFSGKPAWSVSPSEHEAIPGGSVKLTSDRPTQWHSSDAEITDGVAHIPASAQVGTLVHVDADAGNEHRALTIRVCEPVRWRWSSVEGPNDTTLQFTPSWKISEATGPLALEITPSAGWQATPSRIDLDPTRMPEKITVRLTSSSPACQEGELSVSLTGLSQPFAKDLSLRRTPRESVAADLRTTPFSWGIGPRGGSEIPDTGATGATCIPDPNMLVEGNAKGGIFMHPAYNGMVGYTWAEFKGIHLPSEPCEFSAYVGLRDGGDRSDGVWYRVEVIDAGGKLHQLGEQHGIQHEWRPMKLDLSPFAGRQVTLKLIADPGPDNNTAADWACWGEPSVRVKDPGVTTQVRE